MSDQPSNWGITDPESLLGSLRVAETGGDVVECADALEWMLASGRLVDRNVDPCPGDDPACPGHDHGDPCHYRDIPGSAAMPNA